MCRIQSRIISDHLNLKNSKPQIKTSSEFSPANSWIKILRKHDRHTTHTHTNIIETNQPASQSVSSRRHRACRGFDFNFVQSRQSLAFLFEPRSFFRYCFSRETERETLTWKMRERKKKKTTRIHENKKYPQWVELDVCCDVTGNGFTHCTRTNARTYFPFTNPLSVSFFLFLYMSSNAEISAS